MRYIILALVSFSIAETAISGCKSFYKKRILNSNINAAASTTAIPLLSSTAAAAGYYSPLSSTTTTTGTLGAVPVSTSSSTISNAEAEIYSKAFELINQSKVGFGNRLSTITDEIRISLNDFSIDELLVAEVIAQADDSMVFCESDNELFTYPAIRNFVINDLK